MTSIERKKSAVSASPSAPLGPNATGTGGLAYVGCRTTAKRGGRGTGLSTWRIDTDGTWHHQALQAMTNPSFLTLDRAGRHLYTVHGDGSTASAFALRPDGTPQPLGTVGCGGTNPVHLSVLDARTLAVANYASGSVAFLDIAADGSLGDVRELIELPGEPGPLSEQDGSHPHQVQLSRDRTRLYVPDKGLDTIFEIVVDGPRPPLVTATRVPPGSGPRHLVEHPRLPLAYVVDELACTATVFRTGAPGEGLARLQTRSTLPPQTPDNDTIAAAIVLSPDARFLYVSNRGHDTVTRFAVDSGTGLLGPADWTPCGGHYPRFMTLDPSGTRLLVAHERSDSISTFTIDPASGELAVAGEPVSTGSPVCIAFAPGPSNSWNSDRPHRRGHLRQA